MLPERNVPQLSGSISSISPAAFGPAAILIIGSARSHDAGPAIVP